MEKEAFIKLMNLKTLKGFENSKLTKTVINLKSLNSVYSRLKSKHPEFEKNNKEFEKMYDFCKEHKIKITSYFEEEYPSKLKRVASNHLLFTGELALWYSSILRRALNSLNKA